MSTHCRCVFLPGSTPHSRLVPRFLYISVSVCIYLGFTNWDIYKQPHTNFTIADHCSSITSGVASHWRGFQESTINLSHNACYIHYYDTCVHVSVRTCDWVSIMTSRANSRDRPLARGNEARQAHVSCNVNDDVCTIWRESKLSAGHIAISVWPWVITYCAPLAVITYFNSSLSMVLSTSKSDITILAWN